ncbi:MAG: hypothetical protein Kow0092_02550 [Deferrisomatales bacterium]
MVRRLFLLWLCPILVGAAGLAAAGEPGPAFWELLRRARAGDSIAQGELGTAFYRGKGVTRDLVEAAAWYRRAAAQGDPEGQYGMGLLHLEATDPDLLPAEASRRLSRDQEALFGFFVPLSARTGVDPDDRRAAAWFRRAAEGGHPLAQLALGRLYARGRGVPRDAGEAYFWLSLALRGAEGEARLRAGEERRAVAEELSAYRLDEARGRVRTWRPRPTRGAPP